MSVSLNGKRKKGWDAGEDRLLLSLADDAAAHGRPLTCAFGEAAKRLSRKPDSVRNRYYAIRRGAGGKRYVPFSPDEAENMAGKLIELMQKGRSLRAAALELSGGDAKLMLRYQNKFRDMAKKEPSLLERIPKKSPRGMKKSAPPETDGERMKALYELIAQQRRELELAHERFMRLNGLFMRVCGMAAELTDNGDPDARVRIMAEMQKLGSGS